MASFPFWSKEFPLVLGKMRERKKERIINTEKNRDRIKKQRDEEKYTTAGEE